MTLMFRMLVLQALYKLSEDQSEFQVRDRRSFQRFLALSAEATVPEAKTLWLFCERLVGHGLINKRFQRFEEPLWLSGLVPKGAQIIDTSLVSVPKKHNTRGRKQTAQGRQDSGDLG